MKRFYESNGRPVPTNGKKPREDRSDYGAVRDKLSDEYCHKVWNSALLSLIGSCLMASCNMCCPNLIHSTGFHNTWTADRVNFCLLPTHPLDTENTLRGKTGQAQPTVPPQHSQPP